MTHQTQRAWYTGDAALLRAHTDGFWRTDERRKTHVPIARMLSAMSASLLFAGSPKVSVQPESDQSLMNRLLEQTGFYSMLLQAAELASAYGGVFLRLYWDGAFAPHPQIGVVTPDMAEPIFVGDTLHTVRFKQLVKLDKKTDVGYWLIQTYGPDGAIKSELMAGKEPDQGKILPLSAIEETAHLAPIWESGLRSVLAVYVPNRLPNPGFAQDPEGASDYEGLGGLFAALDEAYTALMRDVRLGKARIIVPMEFLRRKEQLLKRAGGGAPGWVFDIDEEVFTALDINPQDSGAGITVAQSAVRATELEAVIDGLMRRIFTMAGYSPQSAGLGELGSAESGTALNIRERLSMQTTEMKKTHWWHALLKFCRILFQFDQRIRGVAVTDPALTITFPDNIQPDLASIAEIVAKLSAANAVSTETKVRMVSPELGEREVDREATEIASALNKRIK